MTGEAKVLSATLITLWRRAMAPMAAVGQFQQRVSRRLHPDHARLGTNGGFQRGQIVGLYPADPQPGAALAHVFNQTVGAAIHVINGDDMAVFIQQLQYGGNGGQTGGKSIAARAAFQFGDGGFQRMAGRIAASGIFVAGMLPGDGCANVEVA